MLTTVMSGGVWAALAAVAPVGMAWFAKQARPSPPPPIVPSAPSPETAEQLHLELGELARGLSHDVAGPLRTLDAALRLVEADIAAGQLDRSLITLAAIRTQVQHLGGVSGALVTYCRSAWKECPIETTSLEGLVARVVADVGIDPIPAVSIQVPQLQLTTEVDALERTLRELVHNACVHHDKASQGTIIIRGSVTPAGDAATPARPSMLHLQVDDDGPGIAPDMHRAVFEFFRRANTTAPGAGLGLSLAQTLAERFGGELALHRAAPRGTSAHLSWPVSQHAAFEAIP